MCRDNVRVLLLLFLSAFVCALQTGPRAVPSLRFIVAVSKHGSRAPTHTYPRDPYRSKEFWPDRPGLITKVGKQQMFRVGEKIRHLYNGFISEIYEYSRVMVQSTLVDRTMISAATMLAGLFPPRAHQQWHPDINWQPVTIYPNLLDKTLLALEPKACPRYWREQNESLAELAQHNNDHKELYRLISEGSGRNMSACSQMYLLCQNLMAVKENGYNVPDWAEPILESRLLPVVSDMVRNTTLKTTKMIKILNGMYLKKILDLFQWRTKYKRDERGEELSMFIHVGHDITLMCLLAALGMRGGNIPSSSTTLLIELHHNAVMSSQYEIKVVKIDGLTNNTDSELVDLPDCPSPCEWSKFVRCAEKYVPRDWQQECYDMTSPSD